MKELTIEEKAKRYDKAIERARKEYKNHEAFKGYCEMLEHIFTELKEKESKDEKIRKELINYFIKGKEYLSLCSFSKDEILAWLEKKDEKSIIIDVDKMVLKYSQTMDGDFGLPINCQIRAYRQGINDTLRLEKQGEQKPYGQREECSDCQVNYAGECKGSCVMKKDEWVPKKGDVCKPKKGGNNILLCDQDGITFSFVEYVKNGGYAGGKIYIPTLLKEYELVEPKDYNTFDISFGANDSELQEVTYYIPEGYHAEIDGDKVVIKKGELKPIDYNEELKKCRENPLYFFDKYVKLKEQKPAWSEEDEMNLRRLMLYLSCKEKITPEVKSKYMDWLKSIKERMKGE